MVFFSSQSSVLFSIVLIPDTSHPLPQASAGQTSWCISIWTFHSFYCFHFIVEIPFISYLRVRRVSFFRSMHMQLLPTLIIASIAWRSTALPKNTATTQASSGTISTQAATGTATVEQADREANKKVCVNYWPPHGDPTDENNPDGVVQQCMGICGNMTQKMIQDGQTHSVGCPSHGAWQPANGMYDVRQSKSLEKRIALASVR